MLKWLLVIILGVHGIIHLKGPAELLGWSKIVGINKQPPLKTLRREPFKQLYAFVWILATILFVTTAFALAFNLAWWKVTAIIGIVVSQLVIFFWWSDSWYGSLVNIIILLGIIYLT